MLGSLWCGARAGGHNGGSHVQASRDNPVMATEGEDHLLTDNPTPPWRCVFRWVCVTVVATTVVMGAVTTMEKVSISSVTLSNIESASGGVGLLLTGTPLDNDLHRASLLATRSGAGSVPLLEGEATAMPKAVAAVFTKMWREGVRVFLVGGGAAQAEELCRQMQHAEEETLLVLPTADTASPACTSNTNNLMVSLSPPPAALLAAEVAGLAESAVTTLVPVLVQSSVGEPLLSLLRAAAAARNVSLASPVYMDPVRPSVEQLHQVLASVPGAGVWLAADQHLPQIMALAGDVLHDRLVMLHAHPSHLAALLDHPDARAAAEACAVTTVQWAGPSRVDTPAHRRLLAALTPTDPLAAALAYNAATLAARATTQGPGNLTLLAARLLGEEGRWGAASAGAHVMPTAGWAARLRLVARSLVKTTVMQDSPWLLEGMSRVEEDVQGAGASFSWQVSSTHAPARLLAREEVWQLGEQTGCGTQAKVEVKSHDPLTHRPVLFTWPAYAAPDALLIPNSSPRGFSIKAHCQGSAGREVEVGCQGASTHNDPLSCVLATSDGTRRRRYVNTFITFHDLPVRRYEGGGFNIFIRKMRGLFLHPDFQPFVPQIGGCLGSAAGCTFCFVFILSRNVSVGPGVCYGACSVAITAACGSLLARGIEYEITHSIICTELFIQGKLSLESYFTDAAYGARLAARDPRALRGYQLLAGPLVAAMQFSPTFNDLVEVLARPWIRHMEYEEGVAATDDPLGRLMTSLGLPLCSVLALLHDHSLAVAGVAALTAALTRHARK